MRYEYDTDIHLVSVCRVSIPGHSALYSGTLNIKLSTALCAINIIFTLFILFISYVKSKGITSKEENYSVGEVEKPTHFVCQQK